MASNIGIPMALFIFVGLLAFSIGYDGWSCGRIVDQKCLDISPIMPIVLGLICGAGALALIAAILYAAYICNESTSLSIVAVLLTILAVACGIAAIFSFYYDQVPKAEQRWSQLIAMFASGLGSGVMICLLGTFLEDRI